MANDPTRGTRTTLRELTMVTAWPKGSAGLGAQAQGLADLIGTMSQLQTRANVIG